MKTLLKATLLSAFLVASSGCQPAPSETQTADKAANSAADPHAGHNHGHDDTGPHGGHLLHLEPSGAHAEWTHDDDAKLITVYLDDLEATQLTAAKFVVKIGDTTEEFPLAKSDQGWTIVSSELLTHINMGEAAVVSLVASDASGEQSTKIEAHEHHHH